MTDVVVPGAIDCAARSMERASIIVLRDFQRGMTSLGAIARVAPLLGTFSSTLTAVWWLTLSPTWCAGGDCAGGISEAFVPIILSLPVAIFAYALLSYLTHQVTTFDFEMRTTVLEALNDLAHFRAGQQSPS
jgi:biopolymer transport protein ExbB/TolQ